MERLTVRKKHGGGIPHKYWSIASKEDLVQRLGAYEDLGLEPDDVRGLLLVPRWYNADALKPLDGERVLCIVDKSDETVQIGYWDDDRSGWSTGIGSKVIKWTYLPEVD